MPSALSSDLAQTSKPKSLPPTAMPLISPSALLHAHLAQTPPTRPSTRSPTQPQKIDLNTSSLTHTNGSSVVKIGATTIVCGVRAEILPISEIPSFDPKTTVPQPTNSETHTPISLYNLLVPNLELGTGCSPLHPANTAPSTQAQSLSQRLFSLLLTSHIINSADLAIKYRPDPAIEPSSDDDQASNESIEEEIKAFWVLYIDMVCISYGGETSVFDAAWLSMLAALRDTVLPHARWDIDEGIVRCDPRVSSARRLTVRGCPVPLGFAVVNPEFGVDKRWVLVDPDAFEEQCCDETGCVTVDFTEGKQSGRIVRVEKCGGGVVGAKDLRELLGHTERRWHEWKAVLDRTEASARKIS